MQKMLVIFLIIVFLAGIYVYSTNGIVNVLKKEGLDNISSSCPNLLMKKDNILLLYSTDKPEEDGVNPLPFYNLDEYINYLEVQRKKGINCPVLFLQNEVNTQGKEVYRVRPNPFDFDELDKHTIGFITHVLERCPDIIHDNARIFIPAHIRRSGHNQVRDLVFRINPQTVVVMINGTEKTIQYKDPLERIKTVPLSGEEEVCEIISKLIVKHNIQTRPVVITGFLCVGMGQTLTHPSMGSFTSAIFGHMDLSNDDLSQLFGRITGRTKDWEKYIQTQVYCPTIIEYRCHVMEECARRMLQDHNGGIVTQENYRVPMTVMGEEGRVALDNIRARKETKNPKKKEKGSVPTVIQISEEQFGRIRPGGKGSTWNFDALFACMTHEFKERLVQINRRPIDHECPDPTKPGYKKKITNYVNASKSSKKISTWVGKDKRGGLKTYYVIYLDQVEFRIIVSITQSDELADRSK
jgi:hypothetical protein